MKTHLQKQIADIKACKLTRARERRYIAQLKRRGFSNLDLWSLDHHLAQLIYPRLQEYFKADDHWPNHSAGVDEHDNLVWEMTVKQARQARADVLFAFERISKDDCFEWDQPKIPTRDKHGNDTGATKRYQATQERIEKGLQVFAHAFQSLWT